MPGSSSKRKFVVLKLGGRETVSALQKGFSGDMRFKRTASLCQQVSYQGFNDGTSMET